MSNPNIPESPMQAESGESFGTILSQFERSHTSKPAEGLREGTVVSAFQRLSGANPSRLRTEMMTVAARARQILADLGVAVDHQATSDPGGSLTTVGETTAASWRRKKAARARSKARPKSMAARVSFSFQ